MLIYKLTNSTTFFDNNAFDILTFLKGCHGNRVLLLSFFIPFLQQNLAESECVFII